MNVLMKYYDIMVCLYTVFLNVTIQCWWQQRYRKTRKIHK